MADYGVMPGPLDYETYFGLIMNSSRAAHRRVYYMGLAATLVSGRGDVPPAVIAAVCESNEEADDLAFQINAGRAQAEAGY